MKPRNQMIAHRWLSMIACGVVAAVVWLSVSAPIEEPLALLADEIGKFDPGALTSSIIVLMLAVCLPMAWGRWQGFFGVRTLVGYPPLWVAMVTAIAITTFSDGWGAGVQAIENSSATILWSLLRVSVWFWLAVGAAWSVLYLTKPAPDETQQVQGSGDPVEDLKQWFSNDREITHPSEDRFKVLAPIAKRIAKRLKEPDRDRQTIAVVGPLGSGKSSLGRLVNHELRNETRVEFVQLSLWPFDAAEAAVVGILDAVIGALGRHVNVLALTRLPERYARSIERAPGWWAMLAPLVSTQSAPAAILDRLASIATASGVTIVLWIDDLERFTGEDRDASSEAAARKAERVSPILSLLHLLDKCPSISVVVADTSLRSRLDVGKIARFVERVPRLDTAVAWEQIGLLRTHCLSADSLIDPASSEHRKQILQGPHNDATVRIVAHLAEGRPSLQESIVLLIESPRRLKSALRIAYETWEELKGEIDFDAVLFASVLRAARPELFRFIEDNIDYFRVGPPEGRRSPEPSAGTVEHPITLTLIQHYANEGSHRLEDAVEQVVRYIFPPIDPETHSANVYLKQPQALWVNEHADNWQRFLSMSPVPDDKRDQEALRDIAQWKSGEDRTGLIHRMLNPDRAEQIETFVGQFTGDEMSRLLVEVTQLQITASAADWQNGYMAPGLTEIRRMMKHQAPRPRPFAETLAELIQKVTPHNLPLAIHLHEFYAEGGGNIAELLEDADKPRVRSVLRSALTDHFTPGSGVQLLDALRDGSPYIIYWIIWTLKTIRADQALGEPFDGWSAFAPVLLEAAEFDSHRGIPVLVPFVTTGETDIDWDAEDQEDAETIVRKFTTSFDEAQARTLFGSEFNRLLRLLATTEKPHLLEAQIAGRFDAAHIAAKALLAEMPQDPPVEADSEPEPPTAE